MATKQSERPLVQIGLRVPQDQADRLTELAKAHFRSVSAEARYLLASALEKAEGKGKP